MLLMSALLCLFNSGKLLCTVLSILDLTVLVGFYVQLY